MTHAPSRSRGFTLIEMLISLLVLSVTIVFVTLVAHSVKLTRDTAYESIASHIAQNKLDELRAAGYAALPASGSFTDPGLATLPSASASTTVSAYNADTKEVTVGVSWRNSASTTQYTTLTTLITKTGGL